MLRLLVLLLVSLGVANGVAQAQSSVRVNLPIEGDYTVFLGSGLPESIPPASKAPEKGEIALTTTPADKLAFAWDKKSGNIALTEIAKIAGTWKPTLIDYKLVAQVRINVTADGKPVSAASVELKDPKRTSTQLVDPASNGAAEFFAVAPGRIEVKVQYKTSSGSKNITQVFDLSLQRSEIKPEFAVALAGAAAGTGKSTSESAAPSEAPTKADAGGSPLGRLVIYAVGLGLAIGLGLLAMRFMRENPDKVSSTLEQLGAQIPKPGDADIPTPTVVADPIPKPQPIQKITLDDSAPDPIGALIPSTQPDMSATGHPKLISDSGDVLYLAEGLTVVGREPGQGLSLLGETTVSRTHARVLRSGADVTVTDAGSRNGTYVNMQKIDQPTVLQHGDSLQFGSVKFRYEG